LQSKKKKCQKTANSSIRIIAGQWRGRKLGVIDADGLRPTGDRIRETLFNWLLPYTAGSRCLDAFAGTGALGLEALSRGASYVQFAELNSATADQLQSNLSLLKCEQASLFRGNVLNWLHEDRPPERFNVVFFDPPFADDLWQPALQALLCSPHLADEALIYIEAPQHTPPPITTKLHCFREKVSGGVRYGLYKQC